MPRKRRDTNLFYRLTCDYVFELPADAAVTRERIQDAICDLVIDLAEAHGGQVGGGVRVVPVNADGDDLDATA